MISPTTKSDTAILPRNVNGLKLVNDTLGHTAGDELLFGATTCLHGGFGPYGSVYRIGGDEFVALINANEDTLAGIMEKVNSIIDNWSGDNVEKLSVSIGYASHHNYPDMSIEELSKIADKMMYESKQQYYKNHDRRNRI